MGFRVGETACTLQKVLSYLMPTGTTSRGKDKWFCDGPCFRRPRMTRHSERVPSERGEAEWKVLLLQRSIPLPTPPSAEPGDVTFCLCPVVSAKPPGHSVTFPRARLNLRPPPGFLPKPWSAFLSLYLQLSLRSCLIPRLLSSSGRQRLGLGGEQTKGQNQSSPQHFMGAVRSSSDAHALRPCRSNGVLVRVARSLLHGTGVGLRLQATPRGGSQGGT